MPLKIPEDFSICYYRLDDFMGNIKIELTPTSCFCYFNTGIYKMPVADTWKPDIKKIGLLYTRLQELKLKDIATDSYKPENRKEYIQIIEKGNTYSIIMEPSLLQNFQTARVDAAKTIITEFIFSEKGFEY